MDGSSSEEDDLWSDPLDHISPLLDRTFFANDLNTFPINQPKFAVEFISSSAEVSQTPSGHAVNANLSSNLIDSHPNLSDEEVSKLVPVEVDAQLSVFSSSKHSSGLNDDPITPDIDSNRNSSSISPEDTKSSSDTLTLCEESMSQHSSDLISEQEKVVAGDVESKTISDKEAPGSEIPSSSEIAVSDCIIIASGEILGDTEEKSCVVVSSVDAKAVDTKVTSEEAKILNIEASGTPESTGSTLAPEGITSVEKTEQEFTDSKAIPANVPPVEQTKHQVVEDASKILASFPKENVGSRGGKYNKPPAPEPPQNDDSLRGTSAEPDFKDEDAVHARLVLKRGIVRSLPDVGLASSTEVFMEVNAPKRPSPSPSSRSNSPHDGAEGIKRKNAKENAGGGSPRFLNLPGHHHFGSLTSLFPFWPGSSSTESSSFFSSKKLGESKVDGEKASNVKGGEVTEGSEMGEKVGSGFKAKEKSKASRAGKSREGDEGKKLFPIGKLSRSPSRSHSFRGFFN